MDSTVVAGTQVKLLRESLGLSQSSLAVRLGVHTNTVCNLEHAPRVSPKYMRKLIGLFPDDAPRYLGVARAPMVAAPSAMPVADIPAAALPPPVATLQDVSAADALTLYRQAAACLAALYRLVRQNAAQQAAPQGRTLRERRQRAVDEVAEAQRAKVRVYYQRLRAAWDAGDWNAHTAVLDELRADAPPESRESALLAYVEYHGRPPNPNSADRAVRVIFD